MSGSARPDAEAVENLQSRARELEKKVTTTQKISQKYIKVIPLIRISLGCAGKRALRGVANRTDLGSEGQTGIPLGLLRNGQHVLRSRGHHSYIGQQLHRHLGTDNQPPGPRLRDRYHNGKD